MKDISAYSAAASAPYAAGAPGETEEGARNLSDIARDRFMQALFAHRIEPGAYLSQGELVKILGVPVGPLRDALRTLQAEGWLTIHARSGIELRKPDFALVRNSYQLRLILERAAVRTFAELAPMPQIEALEQGHRNVLAEIEGKELTRDMARYYEGVDFGFHLEVVAILSNPLLEAAYKQAQGFVQLVRLDREFKLSGPLVARTMHEHLDILAACRTRDAGGAEAALEVHFGRAMQRAIGFF
ncbi:GntR family transcriptional regulator [Terrarubrum flagellatum]|uniref:GntR family transcriptional regulator n=1 Tax=Terrirubrum flagellatum TaxID=2895980 RepID=UPI003145452C